MLRMAIFTLALMSGGTAAWLSSNAGTTAADAGVRVSVPMEEVLVAATDMLPGTRVEAVALRWQSWPADALHEAYIIRSVKPDGAEAVSGMTVRSPVLTGEPVHPAKFITSDAGLLSVILPKGKRAVAVRISADTTAGGFILPNDQVDVIHTQLQPGEGGQPQASSAAILRKVRVLAIDQTVDADTGTVVGKTATLELKPEDAESVVAAEADGIITLVLRSASDADEPDVAVTPAPPPAPASELVAQAALVKTIRIFRGTQPELVEVPR